MVEFDSAYKIKNKSCYVKIKYRVQTDDGKTLKGAIEPEVMDFVTGYRHVIPGLEKRLIGHSVGERLSLIVPPEEAFGQRVEELVIEKSKADFHFPAGWEPFVGMEIPIITMGDGPDTVIIREIKEDTIVVDANHPLAGKALVYDLEIIEARPAAPTDICSEWEEEGGEQSCSGEGTCSGSPCQITLGRND